MRDWVRIREWAFLHHLPSQGFTFREDSPPDVTATQDEWVPQCASGVGGYRGLRLRVEWGVVAAGKQEGLLC